MDGRKDRPAAGGRKERTHGRIRAAYLELLQSGELVSVARLCQKAQINRGTFYNHFSDLRDVQESLEDELFEQAARQGADALSYEFFLDVAKIIRRNAVLVAAILGNIRESVFFNNVVTYFRHRYLRDCAERRPDLPREEADALFTYALSGSLGIISEWVHGGFQAAEETIAARISRLNRAVTGTVLQP